jgi:hypothetical protein
MEKQKNINNKKSISEKQNKRFEEFEIPNCTGTAFDCTYESQYAPDITGKIKVQNKYYSIGIWKNTTKFGTAIYNIKLTNWKNEK